MTANVQRWILASTAMTHRRPCPSERQAHINELRRRIDGIEQMKVKAQLRQQLTTVLRNRP
jgi:hypothetical protein